MIRNNNKTLCVTYIPNYMKSSIYTTSTQTFFFLLFIWPFMRRYSILKETCHQPWVPRNKVKVIFNICWPETKLIFLPPNIDSEISDSSMSGGLSSSCLQQRDGGYPYMFGDVLGSGGYSRAPAAHQQHAAYSQPQGTGSTGKLFVFSSVW